MLNKEKRVSFNFEFDPLGVIAMVLILVFALPAAINKNEECGNKNMLTVLTVSHGLQCMEIKP